MHVVWLCVVRMTHAVSVVSWLGGSATARGRGGGLTSDVLAALYLPYGQAEQPEVQPESQEEYDLYAELQLSQPASQPELQPSSQL